MTSLFTGAIKQMINLVILWESWYIFRYNTGKFIDLNLLIHEIKIGWNSIPVVISTPHLSGSKYLSHKLYLGWNSQLRVMDIQFGRFFSVCSNDATFSRYYDRIVGVLSPFFGKIPTIWRRWEQGSNQLGFYISSRLGFG